MGKYSNTAFRHSQAQEKSEGEGRKPQWESSGTMYRDGFANLETVFHNCSHTLEVSV